jgi:hypothetical protein
VLDALPVSAETIKRVSWYILLGMIIAVALALLSVFQVPQLVGTAAGEAVGEAGYAVKSVGGQRHEPDGPGPGAIYRGEPGIHGDAASRSRTHPRTPAASRLGPRGARFPALAGHLGGRHRRAHPRRDLAAQPAAYAH